MFSDRGDVPKSSAEIFFRKVKFWKGEEGEEAPPVFVGIPFPPPFQFSNASILVMLPPFRTRQCIRKGVTDRQSKRGMTLMLPPV